jgi:DNA (cytosine-5)-methyltransferase 1
MTLWFCHHNPNGFRDKIRRVDLAGNPSPAILAGGIDGDNTSHYWLEDDGRPAENDVTNKPPYRVPSMAQIEAVPWNGFSVASTFSGCGGSCLGYRMAGFRVLWASEFVPAARDTYKANHPNSILDPRDIRQIRPEEVLAATGLAEGELDLFDGSPPCASFSTAGKREAGWGKVKDYSDTRQRTDDLFFEYARLLKGIRPKVFVAENVSGLVKGKAKGYFLEILPALKGCGYRVTAKLLDAQWLGVPQTRQRLIFVGVRDDLGLEPAFPKPLPYRYSVRDAISWIVLQGDNGGFGAGKLRDTRFPSPTVGASPNSGNGRAPASLVEAETDISRFAIGREWDKLRPGEKSEKYLNLVRPDPATPCPTICQSHGNTSTAGVTHPIKKRKFTIAELKRICAFPDDFVLTGTYAQQWERLGRAVPPLMMKAIADVIREDVLCKLPR